MRRRLVKVLVALVLLVAAALGGAYAYLRRSLPLVDGTITVAGLTGPVDIVRDADAIPHVFAATKRDALFGLGFVHAQDRLWQMEFQRRIGFGRLSEIFGTAAIRQDRFLRTVGFGRAARDAWAATPQWAQDQVNAYVAGINAFVSTHRDDLPPEFKLLRFAPEPWSGPDVLVWVKMMAWDLSANYTFELVRHSLASAVGPERMAQLMPPYPADGLSIVDKHRTTEDTESNGGHGFLIKDKAVPSRLSSGTSVAEPALLKAFTTALTGLPSVSRVLLGGTSEGLGSNNWVIDSALSATGKPMLANDPHLSAKTPSTWYLAHVVGGDFDVIGATLPGTPAVAIGRNRFIAWGETNVAADVEDLFREKLDATGRFAEFRGAQEPITVIPETIVIKGGEPLRLDVRVTRHGPLVSDAINANNAQIERGPKPPPIEPLAFRWTALDRDDTTLPSFLKLNDARNWTQFTAALREFVVPSQNFIYADVEGHIGYYAPGRIPIRAGGDGSQPADGWTGDAEWTGWVPFDELPHLYDPPSHFIVTANHRPAGPGYPYNLGLEWVQPYRAERITELLRNKEKLTTDDFARIQADTYSRHAAALLPALLEHAKPEDAPDRQAIDVLRAWNFDAAAESAAPAVFAAWFHHLAPAIAGDDLGERALDDYTPRFSFITRFVLNVLAADESTWCDDVTTAKRETCDETITKALHDGVADLVRRLGRNVAAWRWDAVHIAMFPHQGLDTVAALRPLLSRSVPNAGDWSTVNVGPVAADHLFEQHSVAGYRQIIDLSATNDSRFLDAVGQSGHPLSAHYDDFLPDWRAVRHRKMRMQREEIERGAIGRLHLVPQSAQR